MVQLAYVPYRGGSRRSSQQPMYATLTVAIPGRTDVLRIALGRTTYADLLANTNVPIQLGYPTTLTLGAPVAYGNTSYRILSCVDDNGTATYRLPVDGQLKIEYFAAGNWAQGFATYRVGDISGFTYGFA